MTEAQIEFPLEVPICAWCRPRDVKLSLPGTISHGICLRHLRKIKLETQHPCAQHARRHARRRDGDSNLRLAL